MVPPSLLDKTIALLRNRGRLTLQEVADGATGNLTGDDPRVEREWLSKLLQGQIRDPGVRKVEAVHNFLESQGITAEAAA